MSVSTAPSDHVLSSLFAKRRSDDGTDADVEQAGTAAWSLVVWLCRLMWWCDKMMNSGMLERLFKRSTRLTDVWVCGKKCTGNLIG